MYNTNQIADQLVKLSNDKTVNDERMKEVIQSYFESFVSDLLPAVISIREQSYSLQDKKLRTEQLSKSCGLSESTLEKGCKK